MRKRIFASLLALVMLLSLLPTTVLAVSEDGTDDETPVATVETSDSDADSATPDEPEPPEDGDENDYYETDAVTDSVVAEVQALIDALPDADTLADMDEDEQAKVYKKVCDIYDAVYELTEDEAAELDVTALEEAAAFFTQQIMPLANTITSGTNCGIDWKYDNGVLTISAATSPESGYSSGQMKDNYGTFADTNNEYNGKTGFTSLTVNNINRVQYAGTNTYLSDTPWKDLGNSITKIIIEDGVTNIGARAFRLPCAVEVSIPASVTQIGEYAFSDNPALSTVNWTGEWTSHTSIKFDGFSGCTALGKDMEFSAWLPDCFNDMNGQGVNGTAFSVDFTKLDAQMPAENFSYGNYAFQSMPNLTDATLSSKLGEHAFTGSGVTNIIFDSTLTSIPRYSFENCTALTSVTIPTGITTIGGASFRGCTNLKSVTFEGTTCPTFDTSRTVFASVVLDTLNLSESTSISEAQKIISYFTATEGITATTRITPQKFADMVATDVTVDGSLGAAINHTNYPKVENLTITGESYTSGPENNTGNSYPFGHSDGGNSETIKNLTIDVSGNVTLNVGAFLRSALETVKISADNLTFAGSSVFLNNNSLKRIDLTGVSSISVSNGITQLFNLTTDTNLDRYFYFNDSNCRSALSTSQVSNNTNTRYLIANGGAVTGDTDGFDAVTKDGYTAKWYEYKDGTTNYSSEQPVTTAEAGKTYIAVWTLNDPTISVSSDVASITNSGTATLTATAEHDLGEDVLSYQWYKGTPDSGTAISGATNSTYEVSGLSATTTYYCVVTATDDGNTATATSEGVTITLAANESSITLNKDGAEITDTVTAKTDDGSFTFTYTATEGLTGIKVESSDENVATVSDSNGTVTVTIKGAGTTTITVSYAGSADYSSATASFTLTVGVSTYTVSFVSEYGTTPSTQTVNSGTKITLTELTADGYTHTGWVDGDEQTYTTTAEVEIKKDMTFTAVWGETLTGEVEHLSDDPVVSTSEPSNATQEEKTAISDTASKVASLTETGLSNVVDTQKTSIVDAAKETEAYETFASSNSGAGTSITVVITSYMSIQVTGASVSDSQKSVTMDITPMYKVEATTASNTSGMTEANTAALVSATKLPVANGNNVVISMPVPSIFASSTNLYAKHIKGNTTYVYKVTVTSSDDSTRLSFTNPHGFSTFVLTDTTAASITADGTTTYYATLQEAVDAVGNGQTIKLEANNSEAVTVGRTVTFTLDQNSKTFSGSVSGASRTSVTVSNGTYTCVYSSGSSGGGGGSSSSSYTVSVDSTRNGTVKSNRTSASKGTTVTLTVTPKDGYELDELTVTDKNGDTVKLTKSSDTKYTFTMPASKVTVEASFVEIEAAPDEGLPFVDVAENAYYYDAVAWAVENGITGGTSATTFSPNQACTRAQAVTFLWRAAGSPAPKTASNPFTDVSTSAYYYDAVLWAVEQGITSGTSAATFSPDNTCTRGQIVTFLWRADGSPAASGSSFADVSADAYYAGPVAWAVAEGITAGTSATTFSPNDACTRAQIVTFIFRAEA